MKPSKPFLKTGVIGLLVVAMSIGLLAVFPSSGPNMPDGFYTPIIAFEFIQTRAEVFQMFTQADGAESVNEAMLAAFDLGNRLDYIYMGLYSAFLALFSLTCVKISGKKYFYAGAVLSLVVLAGDVLENIQLLGITSYLKNGLNTGEMEDAAERFISVYLDEMGRPCGHFSGVGALVFEIPSDRFGLNVFSGKNLCNSSI